MNLPGRECLNCIINKVFKNSSAKLAVSFLICGLILIDFYLILLHRIRKGTIYLSIQSILKLTSYNYNKIFYERINGVWVNFLYAILRFATSRQLLNLGHFFKIKVLMDSF